MTRRDRIGRASVLAPLGPDGPCRCSGTEHALAPDCYLPGRAPSTDGPPVTLSAWELDGRLETARAEGYDQAEEDLADGQAAVADVIAAVRAVRSSAAVRAALADVLGCEPADLEARR